MQYLVRVPVASRSKTIAAARLAFLQRVPFDDADIASKELVSKAGSEDGRMVTIYAVAKSSIEPFLKLLSNRGYEVADVQFEPTAEEQRAPLVFGGGTRFGVGLLSERAFQKAALLVTLGSLLVFLALLSWSLERETHQLEEHQRVLADYIGKYADKRDGLVKLDQRASFLMALKAKPDGLTIAGELHSVFKGYPLHMTRLAITGNRLEFSGRAKSAQAIADGFQKNGRFQHIRIRDLVTSKSDGETFSIGASFVPENPIK